MSAFADFCRWWWNELAGLLPKSWQSSGNQFVEALAISLGPDSIRLGRTHRRQPEEFAELAHIQRHSGGGLGEEAEREALAPAFRRHYNPRTMRVEVMVTKDSALRRTISLPSAAEENLRGVLGFEMERLTPFSAESVYFDGRVIARDAQTKQMDVNLSVVPRRIVDEALAFLPAGWGRANADDVQFRDGADGGVVIAFPPARGRRRSGPGLGTWLVLANVALAAAVIWIPLRDQERTLNGLRADLKEARAAAGQANQVQDRVDSLLASLEVIGNFRKGRPAAVLLVEELATRLPDTTWVHRLEIKGNKVQISGSSASASALIEVLEVSQLLNDARFVSPVTQEAGTGRERFHIAARVVVPTVKADDEASAMSTAEGG